MKHLPYPLILFCLLLTGCSTEEASELERTTAGFTKDLGGNVSAQQWWRTAVSLKVNVTTDEPVKLWLLAKMNQATYLCDYKEVSTSKMVSMTAPQGDGIALCLYYQYKGQMKTQSVKLTGKPEETIYVDAISKATKAPRRVTNPPVSLCGPSISGNAEYYQFTESQMIDFYTIMDISSNNTDAKNMNLNCNYELESNGEFFITWVNGYGAEQRSRILGYYYHSATTYDDIKYVDLSETHKWDYIDGLSKVQYQISVDETIDNRLFKAHTWYDANFDMHDTFGSSQANNPDRLGDDAYNSQSIYQYYGQYVSALRGISFKIDVPVGMRIGFYLRANEEPCPEQWDLLRSLGVKPYTFNRANFMGTCFCAEAMNIEGNGRGRHRSFIEKDEEVIWMGMEDLVAGGDHDCNDVIFGVVSDLPIHLPTIVSPELADPGNDPNNPNNPDDPNNPSNPDDPNDPNNQNNPDDPNNPNNPNDPNDPNNQNNPDDPNNQNNQNNPNNPNDPNNPDNPTDPNNQNNPDNPNNPDGNDPDFDPNFDPDSAIPFPWTIAYEDVNRDPDFDFNDAVIRLLPDFENERCCITVLAAGSTTRMYLHFDGPNGDENLGEVHELLGKNQTYVNTKETVAGTPFVTVDCVPWPKGYTMGEDGKRFYIEVQRGTCDDCTDVITLALEPGQMPEALLVAGEWQWPMEGVNITDAYDEFPSWARDVTRMRFWEWYKKPEYDTYVSY